IGRETDNLAKILDILSEDSHIEGVALEMQARDFDQGTERVDGQVELVLKYREKTGQPVVALMPEGSVGQMAPETITAARYYVAKKGVPVFPSFSRGAQALGRATRYWAWRDETGS
ncbi:MAG: hypothetical protein KC461_05295, partial [Dehalococcoidia bacterium]|nr:hypothetical protein [Dehalococcoidia bacterium]